MGGSGVFEKRDLFPPPWFDDEYDTFYPDEKREQEEKPSENSGSSSSSSDSNYSDYSYDSYSSPTQKSSSGFWNFVGAALLAGMTMFAIINYQNSPEYIAKQQRIEEEKHMKSTAFKKGEKVPNFEVSRNGKYYLPAEREKYSGLFSHLDMLIDSGWFDEDRNGKISFRELEKIKEYSCNIRWADKKGRLTDLNEILDGIIKEETIRRERIAREEVKLAEARRKKLEEYNNQEIDSFKLSRQGNGWLVTKEKYYNITKREYPKLFDRLDLNGDGRFTRGECSKVMPHLLKATENLFPYGLDEILNGFLPPDEIIPASTELKSIYQRSEFPDPVLGGKIVLKEIKKEDQPEFFNRIDLDGDGKVTFGEFRKSFPYMIKYIKKLGYKGFYESFTPPSHLYSKNQKR